MSRHTCSECGHETTDSTLDTLGGRCPVCDTEIQGAD